MQWTYAPVLQRRDVGLPFGEADLGAAHLFEHVQVPGGPGAARKFPFDESAPGRAHPLAKAAVGGEPAHGVHAVPPRLVVRASTAGEAGGD